MAKKKAKKKSAKEKHLEELHELTHVAANKDRLGCLSRHEGSYPSKAWPDCNYRKHAHDYSIANETEVYNVPSFRSPERWLDHCLKYLEPVRFAKSNADPAKQGKVRKGMPPNPMKMSHCWDLSHTISHKTYNPKGKANFHDEDVPYFHNSHHILSCDELYQGFTFDELQILVTADYNINRDPNVIILPKQKCVGWALKLPAHCPDQNAHPDYSARVRTRLSNVKSQFQKKGEETGHPVTDENAPKLVGQLEADAGVLRKYLIDKGYTNPGIDLDLVSLK